MSLMRFEQYEARKNEAATDFFSNEDFDKRVIRFEAYLDAAITLGSIKQAANSSYMTDEELRFCHFQMDSIPDYIKPAGFRLEHRASGAQGLKFRAENWFKDIWDKIVKFFEDLFKSEGGGGSSSGPSITSTAEVATAAVSVASTAANASADMLVRMNKDVDYVIGPLGGDGVEKLIRLIDIRDKNKVDQFLDGVQKDYQSLEGAFSEAVKIIKDMYGKDVSNSSDDQLKNQANTAFSKWVKDNAKSTTARTKEIINATKPNVTAYGVSVGWNKANAMVAKDDGKVEMSSGLQGPERQDAVHDNGEKKATYENNSVIDSAAFATLMDRLEGLGKVATDNAKKVVADLNKSHADEALKTVKWMFEEGNRSTVESRVKNGANDNMVVNESAREITRSNEDKRRAKEDVLTMVKFANFVRKSEIEINVMLQKICELITESLKTGIRSASKAWFAKVKDLDDAADSVRSVFVPVINISKKTFEQAIADAKTSAEKEKLSKTRDAQIKELEEDYKKFMDEIAGGIQVDGDKDFEKKLHGLNDQEKVNKFLEEDKDKKKKSGWTPGKVASDTYAKLKAHAAAKEASNAPETPPST